MRLFLMGATETEKPAVTALWDMEENYEEVMKEQFVLFEAPKNGNCLFYRCACTMGACIQCLVCFFDDNLCTNPVSPPLCLERTWPPLTGARPNPVPQHSVRHGTRGDIEQVGAAAGASEAY